MVHFVVSLLAAGVVGIDFVSARLADLIAFPNCGYCGGWGARVAEGDIAFASPNFAWAEDSVSLLRR